MGRIKRQEGDALAPFFPPRKKGGRQEKREGWKEGREGGRRKGGRRREMVKNVPHQTTTCFA